MTAKRKKQKLTESPELSAILNMLEERATKISGHKWTGRRYKAIACCECGWKCRDGIYGVTCQSLHVAHVASVARAAKRKKRNPKFYRGQVVMCIDSFGGMSYPVKLDHLTTIGTAEEGFAWFDTLHNVEYEKRMRPITAHESGHPARKRATR